MRVLKNKQAVSSGVIVAASLDTASAEKPERVKYVRISSTARDQNGKSNSLMG